MLGVPPTAVVKSAALQYWPCALDLAARRLRHAVGSGGWQDVSTRFVPAPLLESLVAGEPKPLSAVPQPLKCAVGASNHLLVYSLP